APPTGQHTVLTRPSSSNLAPLSQPQSARAPQTEESLLHDVEALLSGDAPRAQAVLARSPLDVHLVSHVVPLLANDVLALPALRALRAVAPRAVGAMGDALLDHQESPDVRRRLPIALRAAPTQRTCDVLEMALFDPSFEVRYQVGVALVHVTKSTKGLRIDEPAIIEAIVREVETDKATWESRLELEPEDEGDDFEFMESYLRLKTSRGLQYIFALLSLILDREPIQLAFRALSTDDDDLRGTALEYLENVLPERVHDALWPFLGDHRAFRPPRRERATVVEQLVGRGEAIASILEAMRKQNKAPRTSDATAPTAPGKGTPAPTRATGM
ncbi:MAG: hypothetical protein ABI175_15775, partial [Polyangiales bacterium]